jgi:hypothetical protein
MNTTSHLADQHALEARLAVRFAGALTARAEDLSHDVTERLRFAREQALTRAREVRLAAPASTTVVAVSRQGSATLGRMAPWWQRAASALPLLVLVAGLFVIEHWSAREQVLAAADIDTQLLADDLPPAAYSDPGFAEYLRSAPAP